MTRTPKRPPKVRILTNDIYLLYWMRYRQPGAWFIGPFNFETPVIPYIRARLKAEA